MLELFNIWFYQVNWSRFRDLHIETLLERFWDFQVILTHQLPQIIFSFVPIINVLFAGILCRHSGHDSCNSSTVSWLNQLKWMNILKLKSRIYKVYLWDKSYNGTWDDREKGCWSLWSWKCLGTTLNTPDR